MAINPGYALQFKRTLDRASEPKRARATGTVTAVSSDSDGKIKSATVSTGSGLLSVPVPYGTNVYTGMTVAITNDGTPSNAQWRLSGTTSVPGGIQGGSIINHDGNTFAMFDSIWVRNDGVIIVGGDVDLDGDPTGPRVESNQCGYFGYDQYDRQSLAIYAANCDGYYAGDVFLGPEEMSRISVLPTEGVIRVVNEGRTSLEFSPDGNFIRDPLTIGNPVGARINIGDIEDKATFVMRDKHGVAKLVARTGDTSGVYFHVGNPPPEDNSMWFDSATGRLNVNGHVTMQSMDVRGRATFASTGEFMIVDPSDPGRFGVITPKGQYAYTTDALGVVHLIRVDAWGPLTLESEYGSGIWRTWVGGTQIFGDPRYRHFRIERGATARAGLFNGETPVAYMDQAGKGYFTGEVTMESGVVNGDVVFGGGAGALGPNGLSIVSDGDATPETTNAVAWYDEASFTNRTGWIYGQTGITAHNLTIETDGRVLDYTATTYLYARGGASKTGAVRMYAYGNDTDSNGGNIGIAATGAAGGATATVNADAVQITGNGYWKPASDSTTALQLQNAAGTPIVTLDTTNLLAYVTGAVSTAPLGSELIVNGDFASNDFAGWTAGANWSAATGAAVHTAGAVETITQSVSVTSGTKYQIVFTTAGRTAGSITIALGAVTLDIGSGATAITTNSTKTLSITAGATGSVAFTVTPTSDWDGAIDSISLKAIGAAQSALSLKDDAGNVFIEFRGKQSLYNTAAGFQALSSNTTGSYNTAAGYQALSSNTTGVCNTAAGMYALYSNTTGVYNTAAGMYALYSNTTGVCNTAAGFQALSSNTTGVYNTAAGYQALSSNTTGSYNTAAGMYALYSNTTGSRNTAAGFQAGRYHASGSTALTDPENSIYIGYDARGKDNDDNNSIVIGYQAIGLGANTTVIGNTSTTAATIYGAGAFPLLSAVTNVVSNVLTLTHDTSGTAAAGFGAGLLYQLESSTTAAQSAARVQALWYEATHASRKADLVLTAFDTAEREGLRIRGAGSAPAIGFLGATPAARRSHVADPSGGSTIDAEARTAINSILATLETFGLHATS